MINKEYEILVEANEKREYALVHEDEKKALREERTYLSLVEKYANHKVLLDEAIKIIEKNNDDFSDIVIEACVVVFFSSNDSFIDKILNITTDAKSNIPLDIALSRLMEDRQVVIVQKLIELENKKSLTFAGKCMISNGYSQFVKYFYKGNDIIELEDANVSYAVLCKLGGIEEKTLVEYLFEKVKHPIQKEEMALELIYAKSHKAREYIKNFETMQAFEIFPFLSFKEDAELYKKELIERLNDGDTDFLEAYIKIILWYQNPLLIPFYLDMLKYKNLCMQFNELLMRYFYYDEIIEPLENVMETWEESLEKINEKYEKDEAKYNEAFEKESAKVQNNIISFWKNKKDYIQQTIDMNKKYYIDEYFDIVEIWKETVDDFWLKEIIHVHKGIQLLTGEYFAFDVNGLRSRQLQQSKVIINFFEKNRQLYSIGEWFVWGKKTEDELKSILLEEQVEKESKPAQKNNTIPDDFMK